MPPGRNVAPQALIGVCVLAIGGVIAAGAVMIPSEAGYGGVGPNFLPWLVGACLVLCGALVIWEARTGGYHNMEEPSGAATGCPDTAFWATTASNLPRKWPGTGT